jgi:hypothetical protein
VLGFCVKKIEYSPGLPFILSLKQHPAAKMALNAQRNMADKSYSCKTPCFPYLFTQCFIVDFSKANLP